MLKLPVPPLSPPLQFALALRVGIVALLLTVHADVLQMPVHATNLVGPQSVQELDEQPSEPRPETISALASCSGDLMILGAGGKMGPTLARMAKRALDAGSDGGRRVLAVSRWTSTDAEREVRAAGIDTIRCDLLSSEAVHALPRVPN